MDPIIQLVHRTTQDKEVELRRAFERLSEYHITAAPSCTNNAQDKRWQARVSWSNPFNRRPTHEVC